MAIGQEVRLMPPAYVKPYVKRGKTDAADAEAIAEAVTRPIMRIVAVKTEGQQAVLMLRKTRDLLVRQRTMLISAFLGQPSEFGIVSAQGSAGLQPALRSLIREQERLPESAQAEHRTALDRSPNASFSLASWRPSTHDVPVDGTIENPGG